MMFISAILKYTCAWNMANMHDELSNVSRSSNGYFRKQEIESVAYIQHIHNKRKINALTINARNQLFLHPYDVSMIQSNFSTKHEINKMFSSFFLPDNDTDIF